MKQRKMTPSLEDYLETILLLQSRRGSARSVEVAAELGFSKPSVSVAMHKLEESGYLVLENDGRLTLTESGRRLAEQVYRRHRVLTDLLTRLGISPVVAEQDACRMEHVISPETFEALVTQWEKLQ